MQVHVYGEDSCAQKLMESNPCSTVLYVYYLLVTVII